MFLRALSHMEHWCRKSGSSLTEAMPDCPQDADLRDILIWSCTCYFIAGIAMRASTMPPGQHESDRGSFWV